MTAERRDETGSERGRADRIRRARLARREARDTIGEQTTKLSDIDEKAIQVFRANIVLAGILVSGLSIAVRRENATAVALLNPFSKVGVVLLFASTVLAAVTYTSTREEIGVSATDVTERILSERFDYDLVEVGLAEEYGTWIAANYRENARNALLFTLTLVTTIMAVIYLFFGAIETYRPSLPWPVNVGILCLFAAIAKLSGLRGQIRRWRRLTAPRDRFRSWLDASRGAITGFLADRER